MTTTTSSITERWLIGDVPEDFAAVSLLADKYGYLAALFGSTVKRGEGRDLDVVMVPRGGQARGWKGFLAEFGGEVVREFQPSAGHGLSYEIARGGKLWHICFGRG